MAKEKEKHVELQMHLLSGELLCTVMAQPSWKGRHVKYLASQQSGILIRDLVCADSIFDLSSTVAEMKLHNGSVLNVIVADDLSDVLPIPFAKLLVGKAVKRYGWPTSKWSAQSVDVDPPVLVEVHMRKDGRRHGHTEFTDGSCFVDGGVGAGCGPNRYMPTSGEDDDMLRACGLTDAGKYWMEASVMEAREKLQQKT